MFNICNRSEAVDFGI